MDTAQWLAIYLPLFLILFVFLPASQRRRLLAARKRKRERRAMANELLKKYIGKTCTVSTGSFGTTAVGVISTVEDNWIEVATKKGPRLFNTDYVTNIIPEPQKGK